jgi:O-antigen/teichoic acid export membrane protein
MMAQGVVMMPMVIRNAGIGTYGAFIMWQITLTLLFAVSYFGIGYNYRRSLASTSNLESRRNLFEPQFTYQFLTLTFISILILVSNKWMARTFSISESVSSWILILWFAMHFFYFQATEYFRFTARFDQYNLINAVLVLLTVAGIFICVAFHIPLNLSSLLLLTTASKALVSFPAVIAMFREMGLPRFRLPLKKLKSDMTVGWPLLLDTIFTMILGAGDRYLIAVFLSISDVGRYQPGYQLAYLLVFIPRCGETMLPPIIARMVDSGDKASAERIASKLLSFFLMIAIPYAVGAVMAGPTIILMLSNRDAAEATVWVTALVVVGTVFYGVSLLGFQAAYVLGKTRIVLWANLVGAALNIALNVILLRLFHNLTVAAVASLVSYVAGCVYVIWELRAIWRLHIDWANVARYVTAASAMGVVLLAVGFEPVTVRDIKVLLLLEYIALGAAIYFGVLWTIGGFNIRQMGNVLHSLLRRG